MGSNWHLWKHEPTTPPRPSGDTAGFTGYPFTTNVYSTDPEGSNIMYLVSWGDGKYSLAPPTGYVASGTTMSTSHTYQSTGIYDVTVCAFDSDGLQSDWSPKLTVNILTPPPDGGGCPYVSTWNGTDYVLDNNLIPAAEHSNGTDVTDYYVLQRMLAQRPDGSYSLSLSEFEKEHDFFDHVQLIAVSHQ